MLFDTSVADHELLEQWVKDIGIVYNEHLIIKNTVDKGVGVFLKEIGRSGDPTNPSDCEEPSDSVPIELIRCPRKNVFNMYTLRDFVGKLEDKGKDIIRKVLSIIFRNIRPSESNIIIGHFIGFSICLKKGIECGEEVSKYLTVLSKTKVGSPYTDQRDALEDFVEDFPGNILMNSLVNELKMWDIIIEELKEEELQIETNEVLQLCAAVRSRVLEIPRGDEENEGDDYYVDVTLVPIIDFVNHDVGKCNAYFDVDKDNGDVVLYYKGGEIEDENGKEIFIKYDEVEDLHRMFINYGFIPRDSGVGKIIEIPILGYGNEDSKLSDISEIEISKRLLISGQSPNVQFLIKFEESGRIFDCEVIEIENYSWIVFVDGINWDEWEEENEYNEKKLVEEEDCTLFAQKYNRCREMIEGLDDRVEQARLKFKGYVRGFMAPFWKRAGLGAELSVEYERPMGESCSIVNLLGLYAEIGRFCQERGINVVSEQKKEDEMKFENGDKGKNGLDLELDVDGVLGHRLRPVYNWRRGHVDVEEELGGMRL